MVAAVTRRAALLAALACALPACQCGFDTSKLDAIACSTEADCAPGMDCVGGTCSRRDCAVAADCGDARVFECVDGRCAARQCSDVVPCPRGFDCVDGACAPSSRCELHAECDDGVWCNGDERCVDGSCEPGELRDCGLVLAPCEVARCDEASHTCRAEPADDGSPCEDGDPCTGPDTCASHVCVGTGNACDDDLPCTPGDCIPGVGCVVDPGACMIDAACWAPGDPNPQDPCTACDPNADPRAWSAGPAGPCDDGDDCTANDACAAGLCAGQAYACDDGLGCTTDLCDGRGGCRQDTNAGACLIDGACRAAGEANPENPCLACDPAVDPAGWSPAALGVPADDGIACTTESCAGGVAVHTPDDAACGGGQVCAVCAGGCATPPSLTVDCGWGEAVPGGAARTCTVRGSADAACLSCTSQLGMTSLARDDFAGCPSLGALGWDVVDGVAPTCDFGGERLEFDYSGVTRLEQYFDTRDLDSVRMCFRMQDVDMAPRDSVAIELDVGVGWNEVWSHGGGPFEGVDYLATTLCVDLDALEPAAADNPNLGVRFVVDTSFALAIIDDIAIDAWDSATIAYPGRVASSDFAGCDLDGWVAGGDGVDCPGTIGANAGLDVLQVNDATSDLTRTFDLSDRCDDIRVGLSTAAHGGFWPRDHTTLFSDRGEGDVQLFNGGAGSRPNDTFFASELVVSHRDPDVRFQPAVTLRFEVEAGAAGATQFLDDVWVDGATCGSGDAILTLGPIVPAGGGNATLTVSSPVQTTAYVGCTWGAAGTPIARDQVVFQY